MEMNINRRTILKGILGAAASCFCPVLAKDLVPELQEPFVECRKSGQYLLQINCALGKVLGIGNHDVLVRSGNEVIGHMMATVSNSLNDEPIALYMNSTMIASLKKGDKLSAEYRLNGVSDKRPVAIDLSAIEVDEDHRMSYTSTTFVESELKKSLEVKVD